MDDLAARAVEGALRQGSYLLDAIGLETFCFRQLVATIDRAMGGHPPIVPVPPALGCAVVWALGRLRGDVLLTREELRG